MLREATPLAPPALWRRCPPRGRNAGGRPGGDGGVGGGRGAVDLKARLLELPLVRRTARRSTTGCRSTAAAVHQLPPRPAHRPAGRLGRAGIGPRVKLKTSREPGPVTPRGWPPYARPSGTRWSSSPTPTGRWAASRRCTGPGGFARGVGRALVRGARQLRRPGGPAAATGGAPPTAGDRRGQHGLTGGDFRDLHTPARWTACRPTSPAAGGHRAAADRGFCGGPPPRSVRALRARRSPPTPSARYGARHLQFFHDHVRVESAAPRGPPRPRGRRAGPDPGRPGLGPRREVGRRGALPRPRDAPVLIRPGSGGPPVAALPRAAPWTAPRCGASASRSRKTLPESGNARPFSGSA